MKEDGPGVKLEATETVESKDEQNDEENIRPVKRVSSTKHTISTASVY